MVDALVAGLFGGVAPSVRFHGVPAFLGINNTSASVEAAGGVDRSGLRFDINEEVLPEPVGTGLRIFEVRPCLSSISAPLRLVVVNVVAPLPACPAQKNFQSLWGGYATQ